jgi:hypothetical protein
MNATIDTNMAMARATIVSCYYKLEKSKHSPETYDGWIKNLLLNVNNPMIIFVGSAEEPYIRAIIDQNNNMNNINNMNNMNNMNNINNNNPQYVLIVKNLNELPLVKDYAPEFWLQQEKMDPNPRCGRGQDCYKIWNSKFYFLKEAIQLNPFNSDKFVWNDIGNIRSNSEAINMLKTYPNYNAISVDKLDIVLLNHFTDQNQLFFCNEVHFSGSMFGGGREILLQLCDLFYLYFSIYARQNQFIGCDQQILSTLFLKNINKFNYIIPKNAGIDVWFYLYSHYSIINNY